MGSLLREDGRVNGHPAAKVGGGSKRPHRADIRVTPPSKDTSMTHPKFLQLLPGYYVKTNVIAFTA